MRAAFSIMKRELRSFFVSPTAYALLTTWLLWCGMQFGMLSQYYSTNVSAGGTDTPLSSFFGGTMLFYMPLLVFVPVLTMRLIAGERTSGSLEALLTAPVRERDVILGKYAAALTFYCTLWVPTLLYVWITSRFGDVDMGTVASSYVGVFAMGSLFIAVGVLMSTISPNQIVAATLTFMALGMLFAVGILQYVFSDTLGQLFAFLSVWSHMQDFAGGLVDSRALAFYGSMTGFALFAAIRVLEWRRIRS